MEADGDQREEREWCGEARGSIKLWKTFFTKADSKTSGNSPPLAGESGSAADDDDDDDDVAVVVAAACNAQHMSVKRVRNRSGDCWAVVPTTAVPAVAVVVGGGDSEAAVVATVVKLSS